MYYNTEKEITKTLDFPNRDEFQYRKRMFLLGLSEQLQESSKVWFAVFVGILILSWPAKVALEGAFTRYLVASYEPPIVVANPYHPESLEILKKGVLPQVGPGVYSSFAQIKNPNPDLSVSRFTYRFLLRSGDGGTLGSFSGESYLLAGESKFLVLPTARLSTRPSSVDLVFDEVNWVRRAPSLDVKFDVLQQKTGLSPEGEFFVEFLVKNPQGYRLKKVDVQVLVFDRESKDILAVNSSHFTDLKSFESRYVRVLWPKAPLDFGQIQVTPTVNALDPGAVLDQNNKIPVR